MGTELEKAGVDLTVHVVGFGLKKSAMKEPGAYELRYELGDERILARQPLVAR